MRIAAIGLVATVAALVAAGSTARGSAGCHASSQHTRSVNLDADPGRETVVLFELTSCDHQQQSAGIRIGDRCRGSLNQFLVSGAFRTLAAPSYRVAEADGATPRREVFFALTGRTSTGPLGVAKVIRLDRSKSGCSVPRALFAYSTAGYTADELVDWTVVLKDVSPAFPGQEIHVTETFRGSGPRTKVFSGYRYDRALRRYRLYVQS